MKLKELIKFANEYADKYPNMLENDVILTVSRRRKVKGDYYRRYTITDIGFNSLVSKDSLNIGITES